MVEDRREREGEERKHKRTMEQGKSMMEGKGEIEQKEVKERGQGGSRVVGEKGRGSVMGERKGRCPEFAF